MKMIKLLQGAVVIMFMLMTITGLGILFLAPEKMDPFRALVGTLFPIFLTMVVPALIGSPLTDAVRNLTGAKAVPIAGSAGDPAPAAGEGSPPGPGL